MVVIPTYDEAKNIERMVRTIRALPEPMEIIIVDDGSPDGTGEIADRLAKEDGGIHVIHRAGKQGLGTAYVNGFKYALAHGADVVIEMDADFSHDPGSLPDFLSKIREADLVVGSRYRNGVRVINWSFKRL